MLYFDRIEVFEGIDKSASKQVDQKIIKQKNLLPNIKMGKEILTFGDIKIEKNKAYHNTPIF